MGSNPPTLPYDPMTPSLADYNAAVKERQLAFAHNQQLNTQTNDKAEKARGQAAFKEKADKAEAIRQALRKSGQMK